jgi:hypothetical protein
MHTRIGCTSDLHRTHRDQSHNEDVTAPAAALAVTVRSLRHEGSHYSPNHMCMTGLVYIP